MKRLIQGLALLAIGTVVACVTINIYFPAEEIRGVADRIVDEVYGEPAKPVTTPPAQPGSSFFQYLRADRRPMPPRTWMSPLRKSVPSGKT